MADVVDGSHSKIDWSTIHLTSDSDALALWRRIAPTGGDWPERISELPDDDDIVRPLAYAVIRGGNVTCLPPPPPACSSAPADRTVDDRATFDDPCLRRDLAKWSLAQLDGDNAHELRDGLITLVSQPNDDELAGAVLGHLQLLPVGIREDLVIYADRAGNRDAVNENLGALNDDELERLAVDHHIDGAVRQLDAAQSRKAYLEAIASTDFRPETRIRAMHDLLELHDARAASKDFQTAVEHAVDDPDCVVASAAVRTLTTLGVPTARLHRPMSSNVDASWRALCMIASDPGDAHGNHADPKLLVGPRGLTTIDHVHPESGATSDDTAPAIVNEKSTIARGDITELPFAEEFAKVWSRCKGPSCTFPDGGTISAHFVPASGGGLYLDRVEHNDGDPNGPSVSCTASPAQ